MGQFSKIVILGSGNVGTHLGHAFREAGQDVVQIYSRNMDHAARLASDLGSAFTDRMDSLLPGADIYIIAVTDDAIEDIATRFPFQEKLLVHTSGTVPMRVLQTGSSRYGVFYPLQTFSRGVRLDYKTVPVCLEASHDEDKDFLESLAYTFSETVQWTDSAQRRMLHVAAVFACNFVNHMYSVSSDILNDHGLSFDLLRPLIKETARKAQVGEPKDIQTGPARRNNTKVMEKHLDLLRPYPDYRKLYNFISESIRKEHRE